MVMSSGEMSQIEMWKCVAHEERKEVFELFTKRRRRSFV